MLKARHHNQAGMTLMSMVISVGLFSIMLAGLTSFVSFMARQQKQIQQKVTDIALRQELTNILNATQSWQNAKTGALNQASFACLTDRTLPCSGVRTTDQKYHRFSLYNSAATNSQPMFPDSPLGLGGFTSDGRVCVHASNETPGTGSDTCPYFVEVGWRFQCDPPCLTDTIEISADIKYVPRTQPKAPPKAKVLPVLVTVREPKLLDLQLISQQGQGVRKYKSTFFAGCYFTVEDVNVPIFVAEPSVLLAQGYGRSHMVGGPYGAELAAIGADLVHWTKIDIYIDPGCLTCTNQTDQMGPTDEPSDSGKGKTGERTGEVLGKNCTNPSCRSDLHVDVSGTFQLAPGQHNILLRHRAWHCLGPPVISTYYWAQIDKTVFNISFVK